MGSKAKRHKLRWNGSPVAHAFIVKAGVASGRSICGLTYELSNSLSTARCPSCVHSITHKVITAWVDPNPKRK